MRAIVQRVKWARVVVGGETIGTIDAGLLVLLGVARGDGEAEADLLARKIVGLRVFADEEGKMNRSVVDIGGACLVVSQFTLFADCRKGRRPYFGGAEQPERAVELCDRFITTARGLGIVVATGRFGATMQVESCNDGPVTIPIDSDELEAPRRG